MQKLLLLLLPLAIAACVERDTVPANSAATPRVETYPSAPSTPSAATTTPAQRTALPGRGEGELESRPSASEAASEPAVDDLPDGSIDGSSDAPSTSDESRNRASSSDEAPGDPIIDPTRDSAIIDESGATGFGGRVMTPETLGDGELRPGDDGSIEPDELPMMPVDIVDAGPAMIP